MTRALNIRRRVPSLSLDEINACMHAAAPPLPWCGADGREACSFVLVKRPPDPPVLAFLDAHGEVIADLAEDPEHPIAKTVMACRPGYDQVIFLPRAGADRAR